uniref:Uncharacterized protein n=2 Tax=unclassified bacterial viruses TaxID=12333 RepID=A0AAU7J7T7_9VIRU
MSTLAVPADVEALMTRINFPLDRVAKNCHAVSLSIVKSGILPRARVARGYAVGVTGQHSWVVSDYGPDGVYDSKAHIIDATLWSYDDSIPGVWQGAYDDDRHRPHGWGSVFDAARPYSHGGREIRLTVNFPMSAEASDFIRMLGPLDAAGWQMVANLPVFGWPAAEVIRAMCETKATSVYVPIDIEGHLTDRNPGGLYLP